VWSPALNGVALGICRWSRGRIGGAWQRRIAGVHTGSPLRNEAGDLPCPVLITLLLRRETMIHEDHVAIIRGGVPGPGGEWADLGAGWGAFTLALADLIGPGGHIRAVDRDARALRELASAMAARFPAVALETIVADFSRPLPLPPLDGVVVANALHFLRPAEREQALGLIRGYLRPGGRLIIVEYNIERGNPWVPHPFTYPTWEEMARRSGFTGTRLLARRPSRTLREIYAAVSEGWPPQPPNTGGSTSGAA
jgi:ubiquinone/menaquinone biosynthesis C-methylase UbiE